MHWARWEGPRRFHGTRRRGCVVSRLLVRTGGELGALTRLVWADHQRGDDTAARSRDDGHMAPASPPTLDELRRLDNSAQDRTGRR